MKQALTIEELKARKKKSNANYVKSQKRKDCSKRYSDSNRRKIQDYWNKRYLTEPIFNLKTKYRRRITAAFKRVKIKNNISPSILLGCSFEDYKLHIERSFTKGMSWEKVLTSEIHIDHIIPCCNFDLNLESEIYKCFHYTNLQPLWSNDNQIKGTKII